MIPRSARVAIVVIFVLHVLLLVAVGWHGRYETGPDGVAYVRIAGYWAQGRTDLAVTGYWSPMMSWLIALLLGVTSEPLFAARIVMGFSAVVFLVGCVAVLRRLELPPGAIVAGAALASLMAVRYSVLNVAPDLLAGGLVCLGASRLLAREWTEDGRLAIFAGACFGVAYLAKSVALPVLFIMTFAVAALTLVCRLAPWRVVARRALVTVAAFLVVAGPWIAILSIHYGRPTFSTTARIAHAVPGPGDVDRNHPFGLMFAVPEDGRLTWWEDPTDMPYRYWSPFESWAYAKHQGRIVATNVQLVTRYLASFDWLHLGVVAAMVGLLVHAPWRERLAEERWRWAGLAVLALVAIYLPIYALGLRYYFAAYPFLFAAAIGLALHLTRGADGARGAGRLVGVLAVVTSFAVPSFIEMPLLLTNGGPEPSSRVLATKLGILGLRGPVAGDTMEGLMTAYFLGAPFHGGYPAAGPEEYLGSGAEVIVTVRAFDVVRRLDEAPGLESLDEALFPSPEAAAAFPLKAWRNHGAAGVARVADG